MTTLLPGPPITSSSSLPTNPAPLLFFFFLAVLAAGYGGPTRWLGGVVRRRHPRLLRPPASSPPRTDSRRRVRWSFLGSLRSRFYGRPELGICASSHPFEDRSQVRGSWMLGLLLVLSMTTAVKALFLTLAYAIFPRQNLIFLVFVLLCAFCFKSRLW